MQITIVFTGRHYDQAALPDALDLPDSATLAGAVTELASRITSDIPLPPTGLLAVNGQHCGTVASPADRTLVDDDELMIIAPVAGG